MKTELRIDQVLQLKLEVALEHNRRASEMLADIAGNGGLA